MLGITKNPTDAPKIVYTKGDLKSLQSICEGYIECVHPFNARQDIVLLCNENGIAEGKQMNCFIGDIPTPIYGTFILLSLCGEEFEGLNTNQINYCIKALNEVPY